jgi:hypothetical protein
MRQDFLQGEDAGGHGSCTDFSPLKAAARAGPPGEAAHYQELADCGIASLDGDGQRELPQTGQGVIPERVGACGAWLPLLRYHASMPAPTNERQALEREREELPGQIATYQAELDATLPGHTWPVHVADPAGQKRLAEVDALLTGDEKLGHPQ